MKSISAVVSDMGINLVLHLWKNPGAVCYVKDMVNKSMNISRL